ncbi:MAG: nucleotidyl transferase AbiEii/AbiGii toxin family protein [Deltaproteobacteria bacterium]
MKDKDLEQSIKAKIRQIAEQQGKLFNEVWQMLALERFLVRLACSPHKDKFIFKGGLLLSQYLTLGRETTDLDFLARNLENKAEEIQRVFEEIGAIDQNDGFVFSDVKVEVLSHEHMNYPGMRISMKGNLSRIRAQIQVDIGFGDTVTPGKKAIKLLSTKKGPVFEEEIPVHVYPPETVLAEKIETSIYRGGANSRMKDFHDIWVICTTAKLLNPKLAESSIRATFKTRKTELKLPIHFGKEDMAGLQKLWDAHLRNIGENAEKLKLPLKLQEIIDTVNSWLKDNTSLMEK